MHTTKLLRKHDSKGRNRGSSNPRNGKEAAESGEIVVLADDLLLDRNLSMDIVNVPSHLDLVISQKRKGLPSLDITVLLHEPTGGFRTEEDQANEWNGWDERSAKHQSPVVYVVEDSQVNGGSEEDSESGPHL